MLKILFGDMKWGNIWILTFNCIWLIVLLLTCNYWYKTVRIERYEKEIIENLKMESVQNEILIDFIHDISPETKFSKTKFIEYLSDRHEKEQGIKLQEDMVQNLADIILLRAKEHDVIRTVKSHSLIERYEIVHDE